MVKLYMQKNKTSINYRLTLTSIFLGLSIVFSLTSEYVKIPPFSSIGLTFDLSIFCFIAIMIGASIWWSYTAIIIQAVIAYSWAAATIIGPLVLCLYNIIFISIFYTLYSLFKIKNDSKGYLKISIVYIITFISCVIIFSIINTFFIFPLFAYLIYNWSYSETITNLNSFFFGINNYYLGSIIFFGTFNIIKLGITAIIAVPVTKVVLDISKKKN